MKLIKLDRPSGVPIKINPNHIVSMEPAAGPGTVMVLVSYEGTVCVKENMDEIESMILRADAIA